jgi:hypothetical protein
MIRTTGDTDYVAAAGIAPSRLIDTDALLAVCKVRDDGSLEGRRLGGSYLRLNADRIAQLPRFGPRVVGADR